MAKFGFGSWEAGQTSLLKSVLFCFWFGKSVERTVTVGTNVRSLEHLIPAPLAKASAARRDDLPVLSCCRCSLAGQVSWFVRDSAKFGRRASNLKQCRAQPLQTHAQDMCILAGDAIWCNEQESRQCDDKRSMELRDHSEKGPSMRRPRPCWTSLGRRSVGRSRRSESCEPR